VYRQAEERDFRTRYNTGQPGLHLSNEVLDLLRRTGPIHKAVSRIYETRVCLELVQYRIDRYTRKVGRLKLGPLLGLSGLAMGRISCLYLRLI